MITLQEIILFVLYLIFMIAIPHLQRSFYQKQEKLAVIVSEDIEEIKLLESVHSIRFPQIKHFSLFFVDPFTSEKQKAVSTYSPYNPTLIKAISPNLVCVLFYDTVQKQLKTYNFQEQTGERRIANQEQMSSIMKVTASNSQNFQVSNDCNTFKVSSNIYHFDPQRNQYIKASLPTEKWSNEVYSENFQFAIADDGIYKHFKAMNKYQKVYKISFFENKNIRFKMQKLIVLSWNKTAEPFIKKYQVSILHICVKSNKYQLIQTFEGTYYNEDLNTGPNIQISNSLNVVIVYGRQTKNTTFVKGKKINYLNKSSINLDFPKQMLESSKQITISGQFFYVRDEASAKNHKYHRVFKLIDGKVEQLFASIMPRKQNTMVQDDDARQNMSRLLIKQATNQSLSLIEIQITKEGFAIEHNQYVVQSVVDHGSKVKILTTDAEVIEPAVEETYYFDQSLDQQSTDQDDETNFSDAFQVLISIGLSVLMLSPQSSKLTRKVQYKTLQLRKSYYARPSFQFGLEKAVHTKIEVKSQTAIKSFSTLNSTLKTAATLQAEANSIFSKHCQVLSLSCKKETQFKQKNINHSEIKRKYKNLMLEKRMIKPERINLNEAYQFFIQKNFNVKYGQQQSQLIKALVTEDLKKLKEILQKRKNLISFRTPDSNFNLLYLASRTGSPELVEFILNITSHQRFEQEKSTPFHCASYYGHSQIVRLLLQQGISLNSKNFSNSTSFEESANQQIKNIITSAYNDKLYQLTVELFDESLFLRTLNIKVDGKIVVKKIILHSYPRMYNDYEDSFHGTKFINFKSIAKHGIKKPGQIVDGLKIQVRENHIKKDYWSNAVFVSPSVFYSGSIYAEQITIKREGKEEKWLSIVQAKIKRGCFETNKSTTPSHTKVLGEPDQIEYIVRKKDDNNKLLVPVALLLIKKEYLESNRQNYTRVKETILNSKQEQLFRQFMPQFNQ